MPPSEGPTTARTRGKPSACSASRAAVAMSSMVEDRGTSAGSGLPVRGSIEAGLVEPCGLPSEFTQMTWNRSVSRARPGPIISSHQPGVGSSADERACALGESPVTSSSTLRSSGASAPHVS